MPLTPEPSGVLYRGEHVLESMAELVKEGVDLLKRMTGGSSSTGTALVADEQGHRESIAPFKLFARAEIVHPGAAARFPAGCKVNETG